MSLKTTLSILMKVIFGILLFAGLPLIGWGIFDLPGYFSNPARPTYIAIVVILQIAIVLVEPEIGRLGIILNNIGISLVFRSWLALILTLALIVVLLWRIQDEEALMQAEFGESWASYSSRTWRLLPFIY